MLAHGHVMDLSSGEQRALGTSSLATSSSLHSNQVTWCKGGTCGSIAPPQWWVQRTQPDWGMGMRGKAARDNAMELSSSRPHAPRPRPAPSAHLLPNWLSRGAPDWIGSPGRQWRPLQILQRPWVWVLPTPSSSTIAAPPPRWQAARHIRAHRHLQPSLGQAGSEKGNRGNASPPQALIPAPRGSGGPPCTS